MLDFFETPLNMSEGQSIHREPQRLISQAILPNLETESLSRLDEPRDVPLAVAGLRDLYALTGWRVILLDKRIKRTYGEFSTLSLFKALVLPYLINLPSERALERAVQEREPLQVLCGFVPGKVPRRGTLWNFRRHYAELYPESMLQVLIALVLSGVEPKLELPFVTPVPETAKEPRGRHLTFRLDRYSPPIEVWTTAPAPEIAPKIVVPGKIWAELRREVREQQRSLRKKGLSSGLGLPAEVRTKLYDGQEVRFGIDKPDWLDSYTSQADTLTTVGPASFRSYAACHVLVVREREGRCQVLLSRRLAGYGKGAYTLPGGKRRPDESLQECAARELREETGIRILESKPVSLHNFRLPGKPPVQSVGVLAMEYNGKPRLCEPNQNTEWQWFDLDRLPAPLFRPTRVAINHYVKGTYPHLQWSDVEAQVQKLEEFRLQQALLL